MPPVGARLLQQAEGAGLSSENSYKYGYSRWRMEGWMEKKYLETGRGNQKILTSKLKTRKKCFLTRHFAENIVKALEEAFNKDLYLSGCVWEAWV